MTPLLSLRQHAASRPHALAIRELGGRAWTRAAFVALVDHTRGGLLDAGFRAGDRALFSVRPGAAAVALAMAIHDIGGVLVPQDPGVGDALFLSRTARIAPRWIFAEGWLLLQHRSLGARLLRALGISLAPLGDVDQVQRVRVGPWLPGTPRALSFGELVDRGRRASSPHEVPDPGPDAEAMLVPTSGTTTSPRIVVHTRASLAAILAAVAADMTLGAQDVLLSRDLHLLLPALAAGATCIVPRQLGFDARTMRRAIARHRVTHAFLVTRDARELLEACRRDQRALAPSLRSLMIGAAPVRAGFMAQLREILPPRCTAWCVYGATEVLPIARVTLDEKVTWGGEGDLVGTPVPGIAVRIDESGELVVRGDRLCRGYLGEPPMREHHTGDVARLVEGRIVLVDRAKDMIIRGHHNIYPALHEAEVERIPGVRRAAMIGDFDPDRADETVILVVEPEAGVDPDQLRERVSRAIRNGAHRIDRAALPDRIEVRPLPEGGRSRKVDKVALRAALGARSPVR